MNFTLGCLCALMLFCFIQACMTRAHSFGMEGRGPQDKTCANKPRGTCHHSCSKGGKKLKPTLLQESLLYRHSLKSSRQYKLCWTCPVSVQGNLRGLKLSTVAQNPAL